ncbi:hypothetical protein CPB84DRAFT_1949265 [Gymnopilus junonius]|uniref:Uncharacterized protein n=1 Tax=Gymnopilus junonius TaxID=109634 RepID=A0A9P5NHP0_GYMJU|nr:hypothetical protein CPB84DRAFT_1949265 [Gymnopilus junonius]
MERGVATHIYAAFDPNLSGKDRMPLSWWGRPFCLGPGKLELGVASSRRAGWQARNGERQGKVFVTGPRCPAENFARQVFGKSDLEHNGSYLLDCHIGDPFTETVKPWAISHIKAEMLSEKLVEQGFIY